jgi:hypothetical protein
LVLLRVLPVRWYTLRCTITIFPTTLSTNPNSAYVHQKPFATRAGGKDEDRRTHDEVTHRVDLWLYATQCICKCFLNPTPHQTTLRCACYWPLITEEETWKQTYYYYIIILLRVTPHVTCSRYIFAVRFSFWFVNGYILYVYSAVPKSGLMAFVPAY